MRITLSLKTSLKTYDGPKGAGTLQLELAKYYYVGYEMTLSLSS